MRLRFDDPVPTNTDEASSIATSNRYPRIPEVPVTTFLLSTYLTTKPSSASMACKSSQVLTYHVNAKGRVSILAG